MMTGGSPILGNHHIYIYISIQSYIYSLKGTVSVNPRNITGTIIDKSGRGQFLDEPTSGLDTGAVGAGHGGIPMEPWRIQTVLVVYIYIYGKWDSMGGRFD